MRLYGAIQKVEPQDDGTVRVYGIATSEAVDEQGEIVRADAIRAAIPEYMRFPALREMHQLSAAGTTLEAEVGDDGVTRIVAHVVDPVAVSKVKNHVYRGFSIGGRVTQRKAANPKTITGLVLTEISLVDRPANPEAVFGCWKAAMTSIVPFGSAEQEFATDPPRASAPVSSVAEPFNAPIQIWSCGVSAHRHLIKADALKCMKSSAGFPDRLPGAIGENDRAAASHAKTEDKSMPVCLAKDINDADQMARAIPEFQRLREELEAMASAGDDQSLHPQGMLEIIGQVCDLLGGLTAQDGGSEGATRTVAAALPRSEMSEMYSAGGCTLNRKDAASRRRGTAPLPLLDAEVKKAKHSRGDQALLDMAYFACDQCVKIGGLLIDERAAMIRTLDSLLYAGASADGLGTAERVVDGDNSSISPDRPMLDGSNTDLVDALRMPVEGVSKRGRPHQNLMDLAHECLKSLSDGEVCDRAAKVGARHSQESLQLFKASHDHLLAAGARCESSDAAVPNPPTQPVPVIDTGVTAKSNVMSVEHNEKVALGKVLGEIVPMIERLSRRVDEIARTPLPPLTIAKGTVAITKKQDREGDLASGEPALSQEAIAAALAKMSKEEQTLTLIKASYATPIRIPGSTVDPH